MIAHRSSRFPFESIRNTTRCALCLASALALFATGCLTTGRDGSHCLLASIRSAPAPSTSPTTQTVDVIVLSNARASLTIAVPDATQRWYRGPRFDAGTMTPHFRFDGVDVFGPADLAISANPAGHDSAARGIAGEFDIESPATHAEANPDGGTFVKIGVGELRRESPGEYKFYVPHAIVRAPTWKTTVHDDGSATISQSLASSIGIAYDLYRTYQLTHDAPGFTVTTTLRNTGARVIDTEHYFHTFFCVNDSRVAPGDSVRWTMPTTAPVEVRAPKGVTSMTDSELVFATTMPARASVYAPLPIASPTRGGNSITVRRGDVEMAVSPGIAIDRAAIWSNEQFRCPEIFSRLVIKPGMEITWTSRFTFAKLDATTKPVRIGCATTYR